MSILVVRAFVALRQMLHSTADLRRQREALERKYDGQFEVVFEAIGELMAPRSAPKTPIGFSTPRPRPS